MIFAIPGATAGANNDLAADRDRQPQALSPVPVVRGLPTFTVVGLRHQPAGPRGAGVSISLFVRKHSLQPSPPVSVCLRERTAFGSVHITSAWLTCLTSALLGVTFFSNESFS